MNAVKLNFAKAASVIGFLILSGCSALQIDVDVYKGALLNEKEVQQRQYAYLATSAKPLIYRLKLDIDDRLEKCNYSCAQINLLQDAQAFVEDIYLFYDGTAPSLRSIRSTQRSDKKGLDFLTRNLLDAYVSTEFSIEAEKDLSLEDIKGDKARRDWNVRRALSELNEVLILFAQRILFVVNNESLFAGAGPDGSDSLKVQKAVLQSLANSILVHANDLQRQAERDRDQLLRAPIESAAIGQAFRIAPALAFDQLAARIAESMRGVAAPARAGSAPVDPLDQDKARLKSLQTELAEARTLLAQYRGSLAGLVASQDTAFGDARAVLGDEVPRYSTTEARAVLQDRKALATLYPAQPADDFDRTEAGALAPLREWLNRERTASIAIERKQRLALMLAHLEAEKSRLLTNLLQAGTKADILIAMRSRIDQDLSLAARQLADLSTRVKSLDKDTTGLEKAILTKDKAFGLAQVAAGIEAEQASQSQRVAAMLSQLRDDLLAQAAAAKVTDEAGVHALLKHLLASWVASPPSSKLSREDIQLTLDKVGGLTPSKGSACSGVGGGAQPADGCAGLTQMEVVDALIASLRAQRVQALASGNKVAADNLLAAINVAYEQRTAMIYLRPASDYLRSVHSASELQDAAEPQYRNMLNDWTRYLRSENNDNATDARRKLELEKLYWQNINRVTLGGGGSTNFVLAKDDVGNWYVKAYSSDPEAIFKSATQLALFNAGSRLNVNLLQRQDLRQRLDQSSDPQERDRLGAQLDRMDTQDGRPLLALRARYAAQYDEATRQSAAGLQHQLSGTAKTVAQIVNDASPGKAETCKLSDMAAGLNGLDKQYLEASRTMLETLLANPGAAESGALTGSFEKAIQSGLIGLHLYSGKVYQKLDEASANGCEASWKRTLAQRARDLPRSQLLDIARERRASIERYEDALTNITEVATQK